MGCPKNIKQWWIFKWEGPHKWVTTWVGMWAFGKYEMDEECELCGTTTHDFGIEGHSIVRAGFDLNKARGESYRLKRGYDPREEQNQ